MNKAFKKYGKVKFSSIIPKRLKSKRAVRIALAAALSAQACNKVRCIQALFIPKLEKQLAVANAIFDSIYGINKTLHRSDHPIQARKE